MATGIRDKVAIVGMGCSRFGERWDCGPDDLMLEAFNEALADAGLRTHQIEAAWQDDDPTQLFQTTLDATGCWSPPWTCPAAR